MLPEFKICCVHLEFFIFLGEVERSHRGLEIFKVEEIEKIYLFVEDAAVHVLGVA